MVQKMGANRIFNQAPPPGRVTAALCVWTPHYGINKAIVPEDQLGAGAPPFLFSPFEELQAGNKKGGLVRTISKRSPGSAAGESVTARGSLPPLLPMPCSIMFMAQSRAVFWTSSQQEKIASFLRTAVFHLYKNLSQRHRVHRVFSLYPAPPWETNFHFLISHCIRLWVVLVRRDVRLRIA